MRKILPRMLDLSRELIACESLASVSPRNAITAADVCDKLRSKLSTLMGATGFRALLARALSLATAQVPELGALEVDAHGALIFPKAACDGAAAPGSEAGVILVAQLLGLLVAFIGEKMTRQLLLEIWPQSLVNAANFETGDSA